MRKKTIISLSLLTGLFLVIMISCVAGQKDSIIGEWYNLVMPEYTINFLQDGTFVLAPSFFESYKGTYNFVSPNLIEIETFDSEGRPYYKEEWPISFTINGLLKVHIGDFPSTYRRIEEKNGIRRRYYKNGALFSEHSYKNGKLNGVSKYYYENGKPRAEEFYVDGKLNRLCKGYFEDGKLLTEVSYKDGEREGVSKMYYESGRLADEASYKKGKLDGVRKFYDEDGNLIKEEVYKNGELISTKEMN